MSIDPFPGTENPTLETRLRALFNGQVSTVEPERLGVWYDPVANQLCLKVEGKTVRFTPTS